MRDALLARWQKQIMLCAWATWPTTKSLGRIQMYANGVSDNLAVSQAQQSVAQANDQLVASLYRDNIAKLSLARALGDGQNYQKYLGGK